MTLARSAAAYAVSALLASLVLWSVDAEAAEARIEGFEFSCVTSDGRTLKPGNGDIAESVFADLPAQRAQCRSAIKFKIGLCLDNTGFGSSAQDRQFAECLSVFEAQSENCVGHFMGQRGKCDAGGDAAASADPTEASEDGPFRGGAADTTSSTVEPVDEGPFEEEAEASALAAAGGGAEHAAPLEPFGPKWLVIENQPCQIWNPVPIEGETATWTGGCVDGKAFEELGIPRPTRFRDLLHPKLQGKVAFPDIIVNTAVTGIVGFAVDGGGDVGVGVVHPIVKDRQGMASRGFAGVVAGTRNKAAAEFYINVLVSEEMQELLHVKNGIVPTNTKIQEKYSDPSKLKRDISGEPFLLMKPEEIANLYYMDWSNFNMKDWTRKWNRTVAR